jgi:hypothetical protein
MYITIAQTRLESNLDIHVNFARSFKVCQGATDLNLRLQSSGILGAAHNFE